MQEYGEERTQQRTQQQVAQRTVFHVVFPIAEQQFKNNKPKGKVKYKIIDEPGNQVVLHELVISTEHHWLHSVVIFHGNTLPAPDGIHHDCDTGNDTHPQR
jgi:hypothetical protein